MESNPQDTSEGKAVVAVLAAVLERLVKSNAHVPSGENVTKFHALKAPGISIEQYLERIHKYASCSTECFILALIYIDRLIQRNNFILSELNVHRVCVTAILLAAKFFDDAYYNNAYYAKVGGVLVSEMNGLEVEFLFRINFSLHVTPEVFVKYQEELISHAIGAGLERPTEVSVPECVQPPAPVLAPVHIPIVPNPYNNVTGWTPQPTPSCVEQQQQKHHLEPQLSKPQHHVNPNIRSAHDMQRHITPSPPQHQHQNHLNSIDDQDCSFHPTVSPAKSAPGEMLHRNRSNLFSRESPDMAVDPRPRHNSFPVDSFPMDTYPSVNNASSRYPHYIPKKARMHATAEVLPCSHFGRNLSPVTTPAHLINITRGVYQQ